MIAAIFSVSTVGQVYVGVKCISFQGHWAENGAIETAQGILFGLVAAFINIESWLMKRLINALTAEEGFFVPEPTRTLTLQDTLLHQCDLCRQRSRRTAARSATSTCARRASTRRTSRRARQLAATRACATSRPSALARTLHGD